MVQDVGARPRVAYVVLTHSHTEEFFFRIRRHDDLDTYVYT